MSTLLQQVWEWHTSQGKDPHLLARLQLRVNWTWLSFEVPPGCCLEVLCESATAAYTELVSKAKTELGAQGSFLDPKTKTIRIITPQYQRYLDFPFCPLHKTTLKAFSGCLNTAFFSSSAQRNVPGTDPWKQVTFFSVFKIHFKSKINFVHFLLLQVSETALIWFDNYYKLWAY